MRTLVFSDLHGNLPALETLLAIESRVDQLLCLGDNVNYAPWSNECVELIDQLPNCQCLLGNHEEFFLSGKYGGRSEIGQAFFQHCYPRFRLKSTIANYLPSAILDSFLCTHTLEDRYLFHDSPIDLEQDSIIGHSHQQYLVERSGFQLLNPGSVGQDRKYINRANYAIYDSLTKEVELKNFIFDIDVVIQEMERQDYPQICLDYYLGKERL
ncbi:MAG: metallophosphoesterase family protein [Akkermansiaceae bacterium]